MDELDDMDGSDYYPMAPLLDYPSVWQVVIRQADNDEDGLVDLGHIIEVGILNSDYKDRVVLVDYFLQGSGHMSTW